MKEKGKPLLALLLTVCFLVPLSACASSTNEQNSGANEQGSESSARSQEEKDINLQKFMELWNLYQPQAGEFTAYYFTRAGFLEFLKTPPSIEALGENCEVGSDVYRRSSDTPGYVEDEGFGFNATGATSGTVEYPSGVMRLGDWPVYTEFVDYMSNAKNFEQALSEQGIYEKIQYYAVLVRELYEPFVDDSQTAGGTWEGTCIWIYTEKGNSYFLEWNFDLYDNWQDTTYRYDFYNLADYTKYCENFPKRPSWG